MARSYEGDISVVVGADTGPADKKIDALFDKIETLQHVNIDANISNLQRKLSTMAKRTNEQLSKQIVKGMLKDFKTVLGAMKSEFENNGIDTVIYKSLDKTVREVESRLSNLSVSANGKQVAGLEQILNNVADLEAISDFKFEAIVSQDDVRNSAAIVKNIKETKKEINSLISKIEYVGTKLKKDADSALSEQTLKGYEQKVLGLKEQLKSFGEIDNPLIEATLSKAERKAVEVLDQISAKQVAITKKQTEATNGLAGANNEVGDAAENAAKKADKAVRKTLSTLDKATKKYNEIMENLERGHKTIGTPFSQGTDNWGLVEMLNEVKQIYDTYYEIGHKNNQLKTDNFQMWKSHTASLRGFLSSYAKHYDGSAEAIYNQVQKKKEEWTQYRAPDYDISIAGDDDKYLAFKKKELDYETKRLHIMKELVQLENKYRTAPLFAWTERPDLDKENDLIDVVGLAGRIQDYEEGLIYSQRSVQRIVDDIENKRKIASPKYTPVTADGKPTAWGSTEDPQKAYKYIRDQNWGINGGNVKRLDLGSMAKESPDEASKKFLQTRREINDILRKEKLEYQDIIKLLEVYNQKAYQTLTQSRYIADAINMAADIETKLGRGSGFEYDSYLTTALNSLNEPGKMMNEYIEMYANAIAKRLGVAVKKEVQKPELLQHIDVLEDREWMYDAKTNAQKRKAAEEELKAQFRLYQEMKAEYESPDDVTNHYGTNYESLLRQQNSLEAYVALYEKYGGKIENLGKKLQEFIEFNGFAGQYQYALDGYHAAMSVSESDAENIENAQKQMQKTAELIGNLHDKYGDRFDSIFGSLETLDVSNAESMYSNLIAKEQEYILELQRRSVVMQDFMQDNQEVIAAYQKLDGLEQKVGELNVEILQNGLSKEVATQKLKEFIDAQSADNIAHKNKIVISSYQDLYKVLERLVDLRKQLKPDWTPEFSNIQEIMDKSGYLDSKESLIAGIKAQYDNVKRIKSSIKNELPIYQHIDEDGHTVQYDIDENTLKDAEAVLVGYIYQIVENFEYTIDDVVNDFRQKRVQSFITSKINEYLEARSNNDVYSAEVESLNAPIKAIVESIKDTIYEMAKATNNLDKVDDYLSGFGMNPEYINRYTLSLYSNHIGSLIGLRTPYDEIKANAKKIESYEELCEVVARYNELQEKAMVFGGKENPGLGESEEMERRMLIAKLEATGGKDIFKLSEFSGFRDVEKVANVLGIKIPVTITVEPSATSVEAPVKPVAEQNVFQKLLMGDSGKTFVGKQPINFKYAIISADDLVVSHDAYGNVNPSYPSELQPRDRTRIASTAQILGMAKKIIPELLTSSPTAQNGSPIVNSSGVVIGGNARSIALTEAYRNGYAEGYSKYIAEHASEFGLNANGLPKNPILVRVVDDESDFGQLAKQLNAATTAGYSTTEQAINNAELVMKVISKLNLDESVNLNSAANKDFINSFVNLLSDDQRNEMVTSDGSLSAIGLVKVKQAIMSAAYGSKEMLENLEQINPELANISNALMTVAAKAADVRYAVETGGLNDLGVISTVLNGVELLKASKHAGYANIEEYLGQQTMFGATYSAEDVAIGKFIEANVRSATQIGNMLNILFDYARNAGDPMQVSFDGLKSTSLEDVVKGAFAQYAQKYNKKINYNELVGGYLPAESGSRSDKRVNRAATEEARELGEQIGIATEREGELLEAAESVADATKEQKEETKELNKEKNKGNKNKKKEPVDKVVDLLEKNTLKTLEQISAAERKTRTGHDFNVSTTEELEERFSKFAETLSNDTGLKIGKIKVGTNLATLELYNDELKTAVRYTYQLIEAAKGEEVQLQLVNEVYEQNIKALQENKFDAAGYQAIAQRAVEEMRASLKGLKAPDGIDFEQLTSNAKDITSKEKWTAFNNQIKANKKIIDTMKQSISTSNSMNTFVSAVRGMENAESTIRDYQVQLNQLGDIPGVDKAQEKLNAMTEAARKYKEEATTGGDQVKFFNEFNDAEVSFKSQLSGLRDLSKMTSDMDKAEITLRRMGLALEDFIDLNGYGDAADSLDRMSESLKNFNGTDDVAEKALAHKQYTSAESELKARMTALRELNKEYFNSDEVFRVQDKLYNQQKKLIQLQYDETAKESDLQAAERKTYELEKQYEASLLLLKSEEDYLAVQQRELQLVDELSTVEHEQYIAKQARIAAAEREAEEAEKARDIKLYEDEQDALAKARMELEKERAREQKEQKEAQDALEKTKKAQDQLYTSKKQLVELQLDEDASESELQAAKRKTQELEQQYDTSLRLLKTEEDYIKARQRELQLEDELSSVMFEQRAAQLQRLDDAEEKALSVETQQDILRYEQERNALEQARLEIQKEQAAEQKKQKENQEEIIRLQKKYNEADYKWHQADVNGSDKTSYNREMESYLARMAELRRGTKLTAEQEIEFNRINNEHLQRKQKLLNAVATADSNALAELQTFSRWESDIKNVGMISDETAERIRNMRTAIDSISDSTDIQKLAEDFKALKADVKYETTQSKDTKNIIAEIKSSLQAEKEELESLFGQLDLSLDLGDTAMTAKQIEQIYEETTDAIKRCAKAAGEYNQDEIAAIFGKVEAAKNVMRERQDAEYKWWYGDGGTTSPGSGSDGNNPPFDENQIKQWYQSLNATIQQINKIETKMHSLMKKDDGTGAWAPLIESLESQKSVLLDRVRTIGQEINAAFGGQFVYGEQVDLPFSSILSGIKDFDASSTISDFFNDIRTQTVISEQSIEKFVATLQGAQNKTEEFSTWMKEGIYSVLQSSEKTLAGLYEGGIVDPQNEKYAQAVQLLKQYKEAILAVTDASTGKLTDPSSWTSQQVLGLMAMTNALGKQTAAVKTAAESEAKYFESKKQYANISNLQDYDDTTFSMEKLSAGANDARATLEKFVENFEGGQKIITGFTTSANGISRIDFSVLEEGSGRLRHLSAEMGQFTNNIYTTEAALKNMTAGKNAVESALSSMEQLQSRLGARGMTADNNEYVEKLRTKIEALKKAYMELSTSTDIGDQALLQNMAMDAERLVSVIKSLEKAYLDVNDAVNDESSGSNMLGKFDKNADSAYQFAKSLQVLANKMDGTVIEVGNFNGEINKVPVSIETADGEIKKFIIDVEKLGSTITASLQSTEKAKTGLQEFGASFGGLGKEILQYGKTLVGVYDFVRYLKQGFNEVLEIDTAMTELKKVTEETDIAYSNFLKNAYTSAKKIGSTMKDFTQATADFARLGYSIEEASMLAESANVYMNVGDGIDNVEEASKSIISTMKAFGIEAEDAMGIVDRFNEVGNNFAIDSVGIGDALQRSASALAEAGNTIDESVALVTAANSVIQNPEQVGTALKTLALRLRGAKVELEEAGLETDAMAESTAQLQAKLKALTHGKVDIMLDADTFKSTTQILREIADAWKYMTDIERASALELMGGKRQANILSSLISNFDTVEDVIATSASSANSAIEENAKYLDSMQGRIDQLTNSLQSMWVNALDSEVLKFFISLVDLFVQATDKAGLLNVAMAAFMAKTAFKSNKFGILSMIPGLATKATTAMTSLGVSAKVAATGFSIFNAAATMGLSLIAGLIISGVTKLIDSQIHAAENLKEEVDDLTASYENAKKSFSENIEILTISSDTSTFETLEEEFKKLADGVAWNGENISLTSSEYERYKEICQTICGINPSLAAGYDDVTKAVGNNVNILRDLIELQKIQARENAQEYVDDDNLKKISKDAINDYKEMFSDISVPSSIAYSGVKINDDGSTSSGFVNQIDDYIEAVIGIKKADFESIPEYIERNAELIKESIPSILDIAGQDFTDADGQKWQALTKNQVDALYEFLKNTTSNIIKYKDGMVNALLQVPLSMDDYDQLADADKSFIAKWIKSSELFKIDDNTTQTEILEMKSTIKDFIDKVVAGDYAVQLESGTTISASDILDSIVNLDPATIPWDKYKSQMDELVDLLWQAIGGEENSLGFADKNALTASLPIDFNFTTSEEKESHMIQRYKTIRGITEEEARNYFESLPAIVIQRLLTFDWNVIDENNVDQTIANAIGGPSNNTSYIQTYSELSASTESYNEVLAQTSEIISDNTEVTKEYKDSLIALGINKEDLNECFDKNNELVVKNAKELNKLVKSANKNVAANVKLAKSQARLNYYDLYKEMYDLSKGSGKLTGATLAEVNALYEQMNAIEKTIYKYSLLEAQLLGATNAFTEFEKAQDVDSETDYISSAEGMIEALGTAFNTAELGSETAQAAIAGLVPESVYADLDTVDAKMDAIYKYFKKGKLSMYFDIQFDKDGKIEAVEMKLGNLRKFIEDGLANGAFIGDDWQHFDLSEDIKTLDDLAEKMGVTKEVALAFVKSLEDHDIEWLNGDYTTLFDKLIIDSSTIQALKEQMQKEFGEANVDLTLRPQVSWEKMNEAGWDTPEGSYSTVETVTFNASDFGLSDENKNDYFINVTPILPDGTVISGGEDGLFEYIQGKIQSGESIEDLDIFLGDYKTVDEAKAAADRLHELQQDYYSALESYSLENDIYENISDLAELEHQLANGKITVDDYTKKMYGLKGAWVAGKIELEDYYEARKSLDDQFKNGKITAEEYNLALNGLNSESETLAETARNEALAWHEKTEQLNDYKTQLEDYYKQLEDGVDSEGNVIDPNQVQQNIDEVSGEISKLLLELSILEEPTDVVLQFAIDDITKDLNEITDKIGEVIEDTHYKFNVEAGEYQVILDTSDPNYKEVMDYVALLNEQYTLSLHMGEETTTVTDQLQSIADILDKITQILAKAYNIDVETGEALTKTQTLKDLIGSIKNKTVTISTKIKDMVSGWFNANGTAHASGNAHATGNWGLPQSESNSLVGELGPEMVVDPRSGRYYTVGDRGAEMVDLPKGAIIFNHKQTESLLKNGYVTSRGKAYAEGNAHVTIWPDGSSKDQWEGTGYSGPNDSTWSAADALSSAADSVSDSADEFKEIFDWIEVRLEEINEDLDLKSAQLENKIGYSEQNKTVSEMININGQLIDNLKAAAGYYETYASSLLSKVDSKYRDIAQNGAISIEVFKGEIGEKQLEAIQEYREWVQKGADATQQAEEVLTEISSLAKQAIDNIASQFDNEASLRDIKTDQLEAYNELLETVYGVGSESIYGKLIEINKSNISELEKQRDAMQAELDAQVEAGNIKKYSQDWYDAINDIAALDTEIIELTTSLNDIQDSINEIHWYHFDLLMSQFESISEEAENLIDILSTKDVVDEMGNWTNEGITSLGLYAQQMEIAQKQSEEYAEQIDYLNENWESLGYTEEEYLEKLEELKNGQYDAIDSYNEAKDAIVDLNKERIDAIKEGIEKEIEAYEELIEKKKEELDAEKDLYDFQKSVMEQEKDIADLERQLAALSGDNSASARAKRAQLEAELAEARAALEESYYERSIQNQQDALDKELENFREEKDQEMEGWDEYLENTEQVVSDSLATVQENTDVVYQTLTAMGQEYSLSITDALTSPWADGSIAISDYQTTFGNAVSETMAMLDELAAKYDELDGRLAQSIENSGQEYINDVNENTSEYSNATEKPADTSNDNGGSSGGNSAPSTAGMVSGISGTIYYGQTGDRVKKLQQALNELGYGNSGTSGLDGKFGPKTLSAVKAFQKAMGIAVDGRVGPKTKEKFKLKGYSVGTTGVDEDQWALLDELGEELVIRAHNGRVSYMEKGTGVVPEDLTSNLMGWGELDPSIMLDQNKPRIGMHPEIHNTEIHIDNSIGELIHIDNCSTETLPDVKKIVNDALEKHTQKLNQSLRKYAR